MFVLFCLGFAIPLGCFVLLFLGVCLTCLVWFGELVVLSYLVCVCVCFGLLVCVFDMVLLFSVLICV